MPPLNSLRAFEAAARLNNISAAAAELCVTPAAVAQQVKSLEQWAGEKLFERHARGVELTQLGTGVLSDFSAAFDALGGAVQKLRVSASPKEVRIAALPAVAQFFLSPRLPKIRQSLPDISISVSALEDKPNLAREPFDLAIFYQRSEEGNGGLTVEQDAIFPVCAPSVAMRLKSVEDLAGETFLHDTTWRHDWRNWLAAATAAAAAGYDFGTPGPQFSLYSLAVEECKNGAGVMIGHQALVQNALLEGSLVAPFALKLEQSMELTIFSAMSIGQDGAAQQVVEMLISDN
ncbi:MAG: LysR family transcriptional regulator [Rhizobiaceae bacterium]